MPLRSLDVTEKRRLALSAAVRARIVVLNYAVDVAVQGGDVDRSKACLEEIKTLEGCARALGVLDAQAASPDTEQAEPQQSAGDPL